MYEIEKKYGVHRASLILWKKQAEKINESKTLTKHRNVLVKPREFKGLYSEEEKMVFDWVIESREIGEFLVLIGLLR